LYIQIYRTFLKLTSDFVLYWIKLKRVSSCPLLYINTTVNIIYTADPIKRCQSL